MNTNQYGRFARQRHACASAFPRFSEKTTIRQLASISSHERLCIAGYLNIQPLTPAMVNASLGATETMPLEQSILYCFSASSTALKPGHLRRAAADNAERTENTDALEPKHQMHARASLSSKTLFDALIQMY